MHKTTFWIGELSIASVLITIRVDVLPIASSGLQRRSQRVTLESVRLTARSLGGSRWSGRRREDEPDLSRLEGTISERRDNKA